MKMFSPRHAWTVGLWLMLSGPWLLAQPSGPRVTEIEIRHVGPPSVSDSLIRANIRTRVGDEFRPLSTEDDIEKLYATGFFRDIRVYEEPGPEGLKLIYYVEGHPTITEIRFTGNEKYSDKKLMETISSEVGEPLNEPRLYADTRAIQERYRKAGYPRTTVEYEAPVIDEQTGRGTVTFVIRESPKVKIEVIEFEGNEVFSDKRLRKVIDTKRRWFLSWLTGSGLLKEDQLETDKALLQEFYSSEGYIDFEVRDVRIDYMSEKKVVIRFQVFEGGQYQVGSVKFEGNRLFSEQEIREGYASEGRRWRIEMVEGEIFTPQNLRRDVTRIEDFYGSRGYITDPVNPTRSGSFRVRAVRHPNVAQGTMDLVYEITEGERSYIERIEIEGNYKTKDRVIRRELAVSPGEPFDMVRVKLSRGRLEQMQYFSTVETPAEPTEAQYLKDLVITVEEQNTGNVTMGAGFSSVDSLVGFVEYSQGNFDLFEPPYFSGGGQKFRMRATVGTRRQEYRVTFREPWFLRRRLALDVDLYHEENNFVSRNNLYDESITGARIGLLRALTSRITGGVSYTIENVGIVDVDDSASDIIKAEEGYRLVSKVGLSLSHNTLNNALMPTRGQWTELTTELAGGPFGADTDFYRIELKSARYFPGPFEGHILEIVGRIGVVEEYGDSDRVPLFDRYFLGGAYTMRGFRFRDVGPKDSNGEPIGGGTYWLGSVEYSVPLIDRLRFAMFYDIGNVFAESYELNSEYNDNWGVGFRLNLPIGPIRLDYGIPITTDEFNDSSGRFQFTAGYNRNF
ncbi:MAG TPA: outer membrane protein assembly factor BamA [Methylomirabilota bacterium]|nr:outer membrane protein assembly factor BamA [Methylomirabilota bacterium]